MNTTIIRRKLFDYIRDADEKKVKAIYTMMENEIEQSDETWTDDFVKELDQRTKELESGIDKGFTWEEVKLRAKNRLKSKRSQ